MSRLRTTLEQRYADLDTLGHVNNVAFLTYLQEGRLKLFVQLLRGSFTPRYVVVRNEIDYVRTLNFSLEPLQMDLWIDTIGSSSFTIASEIFDADGQVAARAKSVLVHLNEDGTASQPLPDDVRVLLAHGLDEGSNTP